MEYFSKYIISKDNLLSNIEYIKKTIGKDVKLCAVVKCDAYGLGVENVVPIIDDKVDFYAVANCCEAVKLRKFTSKPILILGQMEKENIELCVKYNLSVSISGLGDLESLGEYRGSKKLKVHIKINSGMNRYGVGDIKEFGKMVKVINSKQNIALEGVYTHFATSSFNSEFLEKQHVFFEKIINLCKSENILYHCCSSFGALKCGNFLHDMVRVGFALYSPCEYDMKLKNVVSIKSKITHIHVVKKGESIGYDCTFIADKKMRVGVVPIGYGDGLSRRLSNNGFLLINGKRANILGYVCMDAVIVDLTEIKNAKLYDNVTILGVDGNEEIDLFTYANILKTSPYEVLTGLRRNRLKVVVE